MVFMGSITISLDEEAYNRLKSLKKKNESFSDVVKRITKPLKVNSLLSFAGIWSLDEYEKEKVNKALNTLTEEFDEMFGH